MTLTILAKARLEPVKEKMGIEEIEEGIADANDSIWKFVYKGQEGVELEGQVKLKVPNVF